MVLGLTIIGLTCNLNEHHCVKKILADRPTVNPKGVPIYFVLEDVLAYYMCSMLFKNCSR